MTKNPNKIFRLLVVLSILFSIVHLCVGAASAADDPVSGPVRTWFDDAVKDDQSDEPAVKLEGMARAMGMPDLDARIARMLFEVNTGKRSPKAFYEGLAAAGGKMTDVIRVRSTLVDHPDQSFTHQIMGPTYSENGTPVEEKILTWRRQETLAAIDEVVKQFIGAGRVPANGFELIISHVGKWANQSDRSLTFTGDIDFSFVSNDVELSQAMKDAYAKVIERRTRLNQIALDSVATAHGKAGLEVYIGRHGMAFAEEQMKINEVVDMTTGARTRIEGDGAAMRMAAILTIERHLADSAGVETKQPVLDTEPGLSMEMARHFQHDIVAPKIFDVTNAVVKAAKYLDRSYKALDKAGGHPANPALADFAKRVTELANAKPQTKATRDAMMQLISAQMGSPPRTLWDMGSQKLVLTIDVTAVERFHQDTTKALWDTVRQGSITRTNDLDQRLRDLLNRQSKGDQVDEDVAKLRQDMIDMVDMVEAEIKAAHGADIPIEVHTNNARVRAMLDTLSQRFGVKKLSAEDLKDKKFVEELLNAQARHPDPSRLKMLAGYVMDRTARAAELSMSGVEKTNQLLDIIDDRLLGPLRGDADFAEFEAEMKQVRQASMDPRLRSESASRLSVLKTKVASSIKNTNLYMNEKLQATAAGRQGMKLMMVYGLVDEMQAYRDAFNEQGWGGFATEIFKRRVPFGSSVENYVMGNTYRAGWDVVTLLIPPLGLPDAAYGLGTMIGTQARSTYWNEQLALFTDSLYTDAIFKLEEVQSYEGAKVGVYRLVRSFHNDMPLDLHRFAEMRKDQVEALSKEVEAGHIDWQAYKNHFNGLTEWLDVDATLKANLAASDPALLLLEEMASHPAVGPLLMTRLAEKGLSRWEQVKLGYVTKLIKHLEDRKQADDALARGVLPDLFAELRRVAADLGIEDEVMKGLDAEVDTNNLKGLFKWLWDAKRYTLSQAPTESETTRAAQAVKKYLDAYKQVQAMRDQTGQLLAKSAASDVNIRYLTTSLFLSGRADPDPAAARAWLSHIEITRKNTAATLLAIKRTFLPKIGLDDNDQSYLDRAFGHELWIKPYQDAGTVQKKNWMLDRAADHTKERDQVLAEYRDWLKKTGPVQLTVTAVDARDAKTSVRGLKIALSPTDELGQPVSASGAVNQVVAAVPMGRYRLTASAPGYLDASRNLVLGRGLNATPSETLALTPSGKDKDKTADQNDKEKAEKEKAEQEKKDKQERLTQERLAKEERERAQQEKAEQEKLTRVPQTFPTEAAFPPTASAEPIWVLKTTETKITKDPDSSDFFNNQMNIQGTSASGSTTMRDGAHQSSHSWSAVPPGRLTPGQKLQFTISVGVQGPQNSIPGHLGAGTAIYVYFQPGGGPNGMGDVNVGYVTNTPDRPKQSKVLNWTVPSGYEGKKMFIIYSADTNPHMTGQIIYTFEYAKLDPNAQSATTSEGQKPVESKMPKVVLTPATVAPMKLGEKTHIKASVADAEPGDSPVRYTWSGAGEASDDMVSIVANIPGKFNVSVSAVGPNRNLGSASLEYEVEPITVNVEKTSPATDTITVGGKAQFKATAVSGAGRTVSGLNFQWQPHPEIEFEPFEKSATTTATFRKPGTYNIYAQALMKDGDRYTTAGESNEVTVTVSNPTWKLEFNPETPLIGQEVKAKVRADAVSGSPEIDTKEMNFRWELSANARQTGTSKDDREITFYLTDDKSASISCLASTKYENENLGGAGKTIRAKAYNITIKGPRPRQEFWMWKSDTQLGGGPSGGMKKVENQYAVDQEILFSSKIEPAPEKPVSYNWTASPGDCTFNSNGGSDTSITCRSTGSYTVMVTAKMDGMEIGSAAANVSVSISQDDITRSNKAKEAYEKLQKAKELVSQGKLDEGIQMADEASKLDPNNTEAATLANKWKDEKEKDKAEGPLQQKNAQVQQLVNEGYELEQQGRLAEGIEKYKSALRLGPNPKLTERIAILERKIAEQTSSTPTGTPAMSGTQPVDLSIVGGKKAAPRVVKGVSIDDGSWIRFKSTDENRRSLDIQVPVPTRAAAVAVVSNLDDATYLEQGKTIARITVVKDTGDDVLDIQAGVHSSEWNYGVGPKHAWVKDADIGDSRFLVVLPLARPGLVNAMRIDYVETNAPKWYGHAPGFCLRGLSLVADTHGMTLTPAGSSPASGEQQVFSNDNIDGVGDDPTAATTFRTDKSWLVTYVMTYHYNGGRGQTPGAIGIRHQDGIMYGPWQASGRPNQGSQTNLYWECRPNVVINPGVYTVIDSHPASWSWNSRSGGGIAIIKGTPQRSSQSPAKAPSSGQAGDARSVKAAAREDSGSKVGGQVKPVIATPPQSPQSPSTLPTEVASPPVGQSESGVIDSSSGELEGAWVVPTDVPSLKREIYFSRNGKSYTGKIVVEEGFGSNSFQIGEVSVRVTRVGANVYKGEYLSIVDGIRTWRSHTFVVKDDVFYVTDLVGQDDMDPTICRRKKSEAIPEAINVRVKKTSPSAVEEQIFSNNNIDGVGDGPAAATIFRTDRSWLITYVLTYHYNGGRGQTPGAIGLRHQDGTMYGPWQASGRPNQGNQTNLYWECWPNVVIKPGVYTVIDSHPASWSWNSQSGGGITIIKGTPSVTVTSSTPGGLIGKWSFDGDAKDSSGNGNDGIIKGATFVDGKFGKALSFDGVDDSVSIGANLIKKDNTPFSIVSWFKIPSGGGNSYYDTIYSSGNCDGSYGFHSYAGGDKRLYFDKECVVGLISANTQYFLDVWHQGIVVYNGNSARIYLDGVPDSNWVAVANQGGAEANDYIGSIASSYYFKGLIDEVRIYNRVLSETEIQAEWNAGASPPTAQ